MATHSRNYRKIIQIRILIYPLAVPVSVRAVAFLFFEIVSRVRLRFLERQYVLGSLVYGYGPAAIGFKTLKVTKDGFHVCRIRVGDYAALESRIKELKCRHDRPQKFVVNTGRTKGWRNYISP